MSRNHIDYTHADVGSKPSTALNFIKGGRPNAGHFDWFWYTVIQAIKGHADEFDRLDSDDDGVVNEADKVDGWDKTDIKDWVGNSGSVPNADYADNAGKVGGNTFTDIQNWVNNNADVPNADHADQADNTSKVEGNTFIDIQNWVNNNADVPNADHADQADNADNADKLDGQDAAEFVGYKDLAASRMISQP